MSDLKPMLAKDPLKDDDGKLIVTFPLLVQPKLDGIRALVQNGKLVSRSLKPIPNAEIRAALEHPEFEGFDGELLLGDGSDFQATTSYVRDERKTGGNWTYNVFDCWDQAGQKDWQRQARLDELISQFHADDGDLTWLVRVTTMRVETAEQLEAFEEACLANGFEGAIARKPEALYKHGRSTPKSGPLWKIKRFIDFEAMVVGVYEEMANNNVAMTNALGRTERSSAAAGKTGKGTLGGLSLVALNGPHKDQPFRCGTGFDAAQRKALWEQAVLASVTVGGRDGLNGDVAKIKSFPQGVKDAPRFPVFLGWRAEFDR